VRKWLKRIAAALAIVVGVLIALALLLPLVARGKRLAGWVERATAPLCGTIRIEGGRFGVFAVFDLLLGRPTLVELDGLQVTAPDGDEVLAAGHISLRVAARTGPLRIDLHDVRLRSVRWRFTEHKGRADFAEVFRVVPGGSSRDVCTAPPVRRPPPPPGAPRPPAAPARARESVALQVHDVLIEDLDLRLDFSTWGLDLAGTSARGTLGFTAGPGGQRLTYEARDVGAVRGGSLRVGRRDSRWAAVVPFDRVQIDRFSTVPEAPADMLLEVASATTGRSVLSGRAQFTDVLWGRRSRWPGMNLDARWKEVGDAVEALERVWGLSERLPGRLDGDLTVRLQGPFTGLAGRVQAVGKQAQLELGLDPALRVDASLAVQEIETVHMLDRGLVPFLGGRLSGRIKARGQLSRRSLLESTAVIDEATLRLDRTRRGPWPGRFNLSTRAVPGPASADELDVFFEKIEFAEGTLSLADLRASMRGATVRGGVSFRLFDRATGRQLARPFVEGHSSARGLDLSRLVPGGLLRGQLAFSSRQSGPVDDVALEVRFPAGSSLQVAKQPLRLPPRITARVLDGDRLELASLRVGGPGQAAVEVGGSMEFDGAVDARLAVFRYPIEALASGAPVVVDGFLESEVRVTGETRRPRLEGRLGFRQVRVGQTPLGDGAIDFVPERGGTRFEGRVVPALAVRGHLRYAPSPSLAAALELRELPLAPVLADVPGLSGQVSGRAELRAGARRLEADVELEALALAYRIPELGSEVGLRNTGPARLRVRERGRSVELEPLRFAGPGLEGVARGRRHGNRASARVEASLALAPLAPLLSPWVKETAGVVDLVLEAEGDARRPVVGGRLSVREPLRVWPKQLLVPVQIPGGEVGLRGDELEVRRLALSIASAGLQVDGRVQLDWAALGDSRLDAAVGGGVDGGALARRLPQVLEEAHGRVDLRGRLGGTVAAPTFDGQADFAGFGLTMPGLPVQLRSLEGRIEARGQTLTTSSLSAELGPSGRVQIGTPEAPARVVVSRIDPPDVASLALAVRGQDLATAAPVSGLQVRDLDLELRIDHALASPLRISGEVWLQGGTLVPEKMRQPTKAPQLRAAGGRVARQLFPEIALDVGVHSPEGGLEVVVPYIPDISVTLDCRVAGSLRRPRVHGRARGEGLYSAVAVFLYDLFTRASVRRCGAK
jgi:hypothetical protein